MVFAGLGPKVGGVWRYSSTVFSALPIAALMYPGNGEYGVQAPSALASTTSPTDQAYSLYLGAAPGTFDIVNSCKLTTSLFVVNSLPPGTTLFARLWTKTGGIRRYVDTTFRTGW
jgi:hypothetical protein